MNYEAERVIMLTDFALGMLSLYFAKVLAEKRRETEWPYRLWIAMFVMMGVAALLGGLAHGMTAMADVPPGWIQGVWLFTLCALWLASLLFYSAVAANRFGVTRLPVCMAPVILGLAVYALWMADKPEFKYVIFGYEGVLVLALACVADDIAGGRAGARWLPAGVLISFVAALTQINEWRKGEVFNHNDVYHLIDMPAFYCWYRAAILFDSETVGEEDAAHESRD